MDITPQTITPQTIFIAAAYNAAIAYNVLPEADRTEFCAALDARDVDQAEGWARLVVYDLATWPVPAQELATLTYLAGAAL